MRTQDAFDPALARAEGFGTLAECYYPPGRGLKDLADDLAHCLVPICPQTEHCIEAMQAEVRREEEPTRWSVDFARLFVGPFGVLAPPYGSVYLDGETRVMGDSTIHVLDQYREMNLDISEDFHEAPDHVAAELEFMHFLSFKEAEAAARGDMQGVHLYSWKQKEFLGRHLGAWVCEFTDRIKAHAETDFYRSLSDCTRAFVVGLLAERLPASRGECDDFDLETLSRRAGQDKVCAGEV